MFVLEARNVSKSYRHKPALDQLSLSVQAGQVFALLGVNGAGKTTFVKSVLGLTSFDSGEILLHGQPVSEARSRSKVAYLPEVFSFYPYYRVSEAVRFLAAMHGLDRAEINRRLPELLARVGLAEKAEAKIKTLSKGLLQRVALAHVLASDADLVILDEPFSGLDPLGIRDFKNIILELKKSGKTVFLNSHILSEVEQIADHVAILHEGRCLQSGSLEELKKQASLEELFFQTVTEGKGSL